MPTLKAYQKQRHDHFQKENIYIFASVSSVLKEIFDFQQQKLGTVQKGKTKQYSHKEISSYPNQTQICHKSWDI